MELTGKCKEAFLDYLAKTNQDSIKKGIVRMHWQEYPEKYLNALIIDFFDSVGIYIQDWGLNVVDNNIGFDAEVMYNLKNHSAQNDFSKKRQDAITEAIKKANEIYNQNH